MKKKKPKFLTTFFFPSLFFHFHKSTVAWSLIYIWHYFKIIISKENYCKWSVLMIPNFYCVISLPNQTKKFCLSAWDKEQTSNALSGVSYSMESGIG